MVWTQSDWLLAPQPFLEEGREWIQQAIKECLVSAPGALSSGVIHCDPRLTEFRFDGSTVGLLDWGEVMSAPHIFDIATMLSFMEEDTDPAPFFAGYLETSPAKADEFRYMPLMLKMRAAVEGWVYARREYYGVDLGLVGEYTNTSLVERCRVNVEAATRLPEDFYLP
jgi:Ser/Thr protein kinase RdoA (MazF antagonist)